MPREMTERETRIFQIMERMLRKAIDRITLCADDPALGCSRDCVRCWKNKILEEVEYEDRMEREGRSGPPVKD